MNNLVELNKTTDEFLNRHWPASVDFGERPTWKSWERFLRGNVPNYRLGGCYALSIGENLIYIGTSLSISCRLNHVYLVEGYEEDGTNVWRLREEWGNITDICTIGFSEEMKYLALSLESFLILELAPQRNRR